MLAHKAVHEGIVAGLRELFWLKKSAFGKLESISKVWLFGVLYIRVGLLGVRTSYSDIVPRV